MLPVVNVVRYPVVAKSVFDWKDLLELEALSRNIEVLVHGVPCFDFGDFAVHTKEGRAFRADGEQVVSVVQNTDAKGADAVRGTEHLHVHGLAAVRARDGFRTTKESDGV